MILATIYDRLAILNVAELLLIWPSQVGCFYIILIDAKASNLKYPLQYYYTLFSASNYRYLKPQFVNSKKSFNVNTLVSTLGKQKIKCLY